MDSNTFDLPEPQKTTSHWWHGERLTPEWKEWVAQKSTFNFTQMDKMWDSKICPFLGDTGRKCIRGRCVHFQEGEELSVTNLHISWYGDEMFSNHKCKLWGQR